MRTARHLCTIVLACLAALAAGAGAWSCSKRRAPPAISIAPTSITIAAASSMKPALDELVQKYTAQHADTHVAVTYGSSGNHYAQLASKAPFDLFYSADTGYPRKLVDDAVAVPDSLRVYARGRLVLFVPTPTGLDAAQGRAVLADARVRHVAIANPQHAPYGRAAREAIAAMGLETALADKLVLGENVEQAAQFVGSGAAEVALLPLSLAGSEAMRSRGACWEVPAEMYKPIEQAVVILSYSAHADAARAFDAFVASDAGREVLRRHGLGGP